MPGLTKAEAARQMGISRTTLYKLIHEGKLSVHPDGTIDPAELVRAVSTLSTSVHRERPHVQRNHLEVNTDTQGDEHVYPVHSEHREHPMDSPHGHRFTDPIVHREQLNTLTEIIAILRDQLNRKDEQIADLSHRLGQWEQRYDRLLEAPAPTAASPSAPAPASRPRWPAGTRERILDHMREKPGPHAPSDVQDALGLPQRPRELMRYMASTGKLTRPAPGYYAYPDDLK